MSVGVFIDRDGTINEHTKDYVTDVSSFHFIKGALEGLKILSETDAKIVVITNQSAVARKRLTEETLNAIHAKMMHEVSDFGARIDLIKYCKHLPQDDCGCRKPKTGMLDEASGELGIDLSRSWFIGDNTQDVMTGKNAGCRSILVKTGYGGADGLYEVTPDYVADDLLAAAKIVRDSKS